MSMNDVTNLGYSGMLQGPAKVAPVEATSAAVESFDQTYNAKFAQLNTSEAVSTNAPAGVEQVGATQPVAATDSVDAQERARRALELEATPRSDAAGDKILNGLQELREAVDAKRSAVTDFANNKEMDMARLMAMQLEVAEYSLLVDATSKFAGKSTQTFDSLLKNQ